MIFFCFRFVSHCKSTLACVKTTVLYGYYTWRQYKKNACHVIRVQLLAVNSETMSYIYKSDLSWQFTSCCVIQKHYKYDTTLLKNKIWRLQLGLWKKRTYANTQQQIMSCDFQNQRHKTFNREAQDNSTDVWFNHLQYSIAYKQNRWAQCLICAASLSTRWLKTKLRKQINETTGMKHEK